MMKKMKQAHLHIEYSRPYSVQVRVVVTFRHCEIAICPSVHPSEDTGSFPKQHDEKPKNGWRQYLNPKPTHQHFSCCDPFSLSFPKVSCNVAQCCKSSSASEPAPSIFPLIIRPWNIFFFFDRYRCPHARPNSFPRLVSAISVYSPFIRILKSSANDAQGRQSEIQERQPSLF